MLTDSDRMELETRSKSPISEADDEEIIKILRNRDSYPTRVTLSTGEILTVHNIAWGYDDSDPYAHVTANISPGVEGEEIHFFFTFAVSQVYASESGQVLFSATKVS